MADSNFGPPLNLFPISAGDSSPAAESAGQAPNPHQQHFHMPPHLAGHHHSTTYDPFNFHHGNPGPPAPQISNPHEQLSPHSRYTRYSNLRPLPARNSTFTYCPPIGSHGNGPNAHPDFNLFNQAPNQGSTRPELIEPRIDTLPPVGPQRPLGGPTRHSFHYYSPGDRKSVV